MFRSFEMLLQQPEQSGESVMQLWSYRTVAVTCVSKATSKASAEAWEGKKYAAMDITPWIEMGQVLRGLPLANKDYRKSPAATAGRFDSKNSKNIPLN